MQTDIHFWSYLAQFFLEWEMFQTKVVEKIKTHILCSITFLQKSWRLWDNVEIYCRARQAADVNIIRRMRIACWTNNATNTHSEYAILIAFPLQQWMHESFLKLRLYVPCLTCLLWRHFLPPICSSSYASPWRLSTTRQNEEPTASCLPTTSRSYTNTNTTLRDHQILTDTRGNYTHQDL